MTTERGKNKMLTTKRTIITFFSLILLFNVIIESDSQDRFERTSQMPTPHVECVKTSNPPIIDGKLTDYSWRNSGKIEKFIWANGIDEPFAQTEAFLLWDNDNFYIAVKCYEPIMDRIKISKTDRDSHVWEDDVVEILIDPHPDIPEYYHLAVNPIGTLLDRETSVRPRKDMEWASDTKAATYLTQNFWTIEMAIPLFEFGPQPEIGTEWKMNLHRKEQRREEYTYWSPTYDKNPNCPHVPERFGTVRFSGLPHKPDKDSGSNDKAKVLDIIVRGNSVIPEEKIVDILGINLNDYFYIDEISNIAKSLKYTGWFEDIKTSANKIQDGIEIIIAVFILPTIKLNLKN